MRNVDRQPAERKLDERTQGGISLWDRITHDTEFVRQKNAIQARYKLPLDYDIRLQPRAWLEWMGYDEKPTSEAAQRGQAFLNDVHTLFKKFEVPESWNDDLIAEIAGSPSGDAMEMGRRPKFELYSDNEGNWQWRCIITLETDLTNPMYLEMIRNQQKQYAGDPPKPIEDKANPHKLDWRPVYEWHRRHPLFTLEEIAKKIGYPLQQVRLKMAELENQK